MSYDFVSNKISVLSDSDNGINGLLCPYFNGMYYILQIYCKYPITPYFKRFRIVDKVDGKSKNYIYNPKNPSGKNPIDRAKEKLAQIKSMVNKEELYNERVMEFILLLNEYGITGNNDILVQIMNLEEDSKLKQAIYYFCKYKIEIDERFVHFGNWTDFEYLTGGLKSPHFFNPFYLENSNRGEYVPTYQDFCNNFTGDIFNKMVVNLEHKFLEINNNEKYLNKNFYNIDELRFVPPNKRYLDLYDIPYRLYFDCKYEEETVVVSGILRQSYKIISAKMTEISKENLKSHLKALFFPYQKNYNDYVLFLQNTRVYKYAHLYYIFGEKDFVAEKKVVEKELILLNQLLQLFVPSKVKPKQFLNHTHIIGRSGSGKSEFLKTIVKQVGESCILLDPHGDIADSLDKKQGFFKIAPTESRFVINPFHITDKSINNRELVAEEIIQLLQEIIQDSNVSVLMKTISFPIISTLLKLPYADFRMLADCINPISGIEHLERLTPIVDDHLQHIWNDLKTDTYDTTKRSIFNRLQSFLNKHKIVSTVCGYDDFNNAIKRVEQGENLVVSLPIPQLGEDVSEVLGRFFMCRMQIWAKRRQTIAEKDRKAVVLIVDECQNFLSEETARTLDQFGRKFGLYMILAHQHIDQIDGKGLKGSMLANCKNKIIGYCDEKTAKTMSGAMGVPSDEFKELKKGHWWGLFEDKEPLKFYARLAKFKTTGESVAYAPSQNIDFLDGWGITQDSVRNTTQNTQKTPKFTAKFDL